MSDSSDNRPSEDPALRATQTERASGPGMSDAEAHQGRKTAATRDTVSDRSVSESAHRDVADLVARNEAYHKHALEIALLNAKKAAGKRPFGLSEDFAENSVLRDDLVTERKSPSSAKFGFIIASVLVVVGLIVGSIWYFSAQNSASNSASTGVTPGMVAAASNTPSSEVSGDDTTPGTIYVIPAPVESALPTQKPTPDGSALPARHSSGEANNAARPTAPPKTADLAGAALGSEGSHPGAYSETNTGSSAPRPGYIGTSVEPTIHGNP